MTDRLIIGLDLATRMGVAIGYAGTKPRSFALKLRDGDEPTSAALRNLFRFLEAEFAKADGPVLVAKEKKLNLRGARRASSSEASVDLQAKMHGVVECICSLFEVPCIEAASATIRKHFVSRGTFPGGRKEAKAAVILRCRTLGYISPMSKDDDRADACAVFDWACGKLRQPTALHLFNDTRGL